MKVPYIATFDLNAAMHHIILIGHRGAGKSTLGTLAASALERAFADLDDTIAARTGRTAASFVREDEPGFRAAERDTLTALLASDTPSVIATGAGITHIPPGHLVVWIDRDGWVETARTARERLRPDIHFDDELAWMRSEREPRFARWAHVHLHIERDCAIDEAAARLVQRVQWCADAAANGVFRGTWIVAESTDDLARCAADNRLFGLAGVELRSDIVSDWSERSDLRFLASLRTHDAGFFARHADAAAFDCDVRFLDMLALDAFEPRTLIISTHPKDVDPDDFDALVRAAAQLAARFPAWSDHIALKYAPVVKSWMELRVAYEYCRVHAKRGGSVSFLPQGHRWEWMRVFRFRSANAHNYVRIGCSRDGSLPPGIGYFLPCATGPAPQTWCGIIGNPVDHSAGDVWHRARSLAHEGGTTGYLKIPLTRTEKEHALYFLMKLNVHGLSVTSPLKSVLLPSTFVTSRDGRTSGNTLTLRDGGWSLTDTDEHGMRTCLRELHARGIAPGSVAVFGRGGVLPALERACAAEGWGPVTSFSAREGWGDAAGQKWRLVVCAGDTRTARTDPPACEAWIDLSYHACPPPPEGVRTYMTGRLFFAAQAAAQRDTWNA